jgi:uncharacterized protein (TIGR03083 family)
VGVEATEHIADLRRDGVRLASAAAAAGPDARVPTCPEWAVRDLVRHLGGVHRWAAAIVGTPLVNLSGFDLDELVGTWPSDSELVEWFIQGHGALVDTLSNADPDVVCWTFLQAPSPLAMWARRQAHETTVHRVDTELASGQPPSDVPASSAADGIDELLTRFVTRPGGRLRSDPPRRLLVRCTDAESAWVVHIGTDQVHTVPRPGDADCHVSGPASELFLMLWNRRGTDDLTIEGDSHALALFLDGVHVRWS